MKSRAADSRAAARQPASSPRTRETGLGAARHRPVAQERAPQAGIERSPLMQAQRRAIPLAVTFRRPPISLHALGGRGLAAAFAAGTTMRDDPPRLGNLDLLQCAARHVEA
jgi:hypothetical protein